MSNKISTYQKQFGPWVLIAGASQGIGLAFAEELAQKGLNIALVARRGKLLEEIAVKLTKQFGIEARTIELDLTQPDMLEKIAAKTEDIEIGLIVYNAALSPIGCFHKVPLENHLKVIDLNCRGPMILSHYFGRKMIERKRGGIILVSSLTAFQGSPFLSHYGATKAYNLVLGEGLWYELRKEGVKTIVCVAGATKTPNYLASKPKKSKGLIKAQEMNPNAVAKEALKGLQKDKPYIITGASNRFNSFILRRILRRKQVVKIMGGVTEKMYKDRL